MIRAMTPPMPFRASRALLVVVGLAACGGDDNPGGGIVPGGELPPPSTTVYTTTTGVQASTTGYQLFDNRTGGIQLFWIGAPAQKNFRGSIWTTGTILSAVYATADYCGSDMTGDELAAPVAVTGGQRIDFAAVSGLKDCLDLTFDHSDTLYFDLFIDGARDPAHVLYADQAMGGFMTPVAVVPFGIKL